MILRVDFQGLPRGLTAAGTKKDQNEGGDEGRDVYGNVHYSLDNGGRIWYTIHAGSGYPARFIR